jgi:hypothetical protein
MMVGRLNLCSLLFAVGELGLQACSQNYFSSESYKLSSYQFSLCRLICSEKTKVSTQTVSTQWDCGQEDALIGTNSAMVNNKALLQIPQRTATPDRSSKGGNKDTGR